jgi:hypothetical protein
MRAARLLFNSLLLFLRTNKSAAAPIPATATTATIPPAIAPVDELDELEEAAAEAVVELEEMALLLVKLAVILLALDMVGIALILLLLLLLILLVGAEVVLATVVGVGALVLEGMLSLFALVVVTLAGSVLLAEL